MGVQNRRLVAALLLWSLYLVLYILFGRHLVELTRENFVRGVGLGTDLSGWSLFDGPVVVTSTYVAACFAYYLCALTSVFFRRFLLSVTGPIVLFFLPPAERREYFRAVVAVFYHSAIWGGLALPVLLMIGTYVDSYAPFWDLPITLTRASVPLLVLVVGVVYHLSQRTFSRVAFRSRGLCRGCGYDLTGNVSGTCPECGL